MLTVLMEPTVWSTTDPASAYADCPRVDNFDIIKDIAAPARTMKGILQIMTSVKSHPLINAMTKPPKNVEISCINFPTLITTIIF